jgi:hypothetical protein
MGHLMVKISPCGFCNFETLKLKKMKKVLSIALLLAAVVFASNAATKTSIKVSDLSKAISNDISKNYAGYTVKEAYKVDTNGVISYEVKVQKANDELTLLYDKDGKFIKKVPATSTPSKTTASGAAKSPQASPKK